MKLSSAGRRYISVLFALVASITSAVAAPYPPEGLSTKWTQPDGTVLSLRVHGDELYGRTTTEDGYTVIFNEADQTYYYAEVAAAAGKELVKSTIPAGKQPPAGVPKQLREPKETAAAVRQANIRKYIPDLEQRWRARAANPAAAPVEGDKVGLTILVQFSDVSFPVTRNKIERLCNEVGYTDNGNTGSIRDYFSDQSTGLLNHTQSVTQVVTLPNPRNYYNYSNYPANTSLRDAGAAGRMLVQDAITALNSAGFDSTSLTVNGNNQVVATSLLFAGSDSGVWAKGLWPHAWSLSGSGMSLGGKTVFRYQCTNVENSAPVIGTIAHELGHLLLDYPDLYDTDGGSEGVGEHCLMGSANHLNGGRTPGPINLYLKEASGWATITDFTDSQTLSVSLPSTGNIGYRLRKPGSTTEYFLIENRGAGDKWAAACKDKGIAIWHIDEAVNSDNQREEMTANSHYLVSIQQADGRFDLERGMNRGDAGDLYDSNTGEFDDYNNPNANWWNGQESGLYLRVLSVPGASMDVQLGSPPGVTLLGLNPGNVVIPSGASSQTFFVNSNSAWSWTGKPAWITTTEAVNQQGRQIFEYTVANNGAISPRTATLVFTAGEVTRTYTVTQQGRTVDDHSNQRTLATLVKLNSTNAGNIETEGDSDYFRVEVNGPGTLVLNTTGSTDTVGTLYSANGTVLDYSDDYGDTNFRIERVLVAPTDLYIKVNHYYATQTGQYDLVCSFIPSPEFSVAAESQEVPREGGVYSFTVTMPGGEWRAVTEPLVTGADASWVTLNFDGPQFNSKTVTYTVPQNNGSARTLRIRAGTLDYSASHIVRQAGVPRPDLVDSGDSITVLPAAVIASGKTRIQMSVKNAGTVDSAAFTIRFLASSSPTINRFSHELATLRVAGLEAGGTLPVDVIGTMPTSISSFDPDWYVGWEIDSGKEVTEENETNNLIVMPDAFHLAVAELAVTPATRSVEGHLVEDTVSVTNNAAWTWSSNVPWISSLNSTYQVGAQSLNYQVEANPGATQRTGIITITSGTVSRTHTITQGAKPIPLEMTSYQRTGDNIGVTFRSEIGKTYRVASSTTLLPGSWVPVPGHTGIAGTGAPISRNLLNMGIAPTGGKMFFRIERE
ncbi:M6 family metalloprotease domain-containing protein [Luteolibacter sp. SL250]|uniref:M6 family metalloprotease domain-containing protein n=1 Tax=Luteolibacter sp. SL250 TaxID=2995170 RepID=UPI00226F5782|nr:M6 family metalloprotease domain-containing protein [Luteolibacter sp. SL250]WAC18445.1 M6 family metalloprotease domain-containing protein [Luteolibacter sp. SL250]